MRISYLYILSLIAGLIFVPDMVFAVNHLKKDTSYALDATVAKTELMQAKAWYEDTYPFANIDQGADITNPAIGSNVDFSHIIRPDWRHTAQYNRLNSDVIEMPLDSGNKYVFELKNATANKVCSNWKYNRTYFLILKNDKGFQAFVMMIMSDSAYVNNDLEKLKHNSYRNNDPDFGGMVLYFTPKGQYVSGYKYIKGELITPASSLSAVVHSTNNIESKTIEKSCVDWYLITYAIGKLNKDVAVQKADKGGATFYNEEYIGTSCFKVNIDTSSTTDNKANGATDNSSKSATPPGPACAIPH